MSYKSTLQEHNILLQQAIDKANTLPDAGGSSSTVETCTITINHYGSHDPSYAPYHLAYVMMDTSGAITSFASDLDVYTEENPIILQNIVKGSLLYISTTLATNPSITNGIKLLSSGGHFIQIDGDGEITLTPIG